MCFNSCALFKIEYIKAKKNIIKKENRVKKIENSVKFFFKLKQVRKMLFKFL